MNKYVKKPVEITAIQYQWDDQAISMDEAQDLIADFVNDNIAIIDDEILLNGVHGQVEVKRGDWVIKQNDNDFYPCSDQVFQHNYMPVPSSWLDRVKLEQADIETDLNALTKTLDVSKKPDFICEEQWILMSRQQFHMRMYNQILQQRISQATESNDSQ